jgi:hypothetical protein
MHKRKKNMVEILHRGYVRPAQAFTSSSLKERRAGTAGGRCDALPKQWRPHA